jgi:hypothetical protein
MRRIIAPLISVIAIAGIAVGNARPTVASAPADTLYATGWGDHIVTLDQNDGSITRLTPQPGFLFNALAFDSAGRLFATGCTPSNPCPPSDPTGKVLMELEPLTGVVLDTIGIVADASDVVRIIALSVQPGTDVLYGIGRGYRDDRQLWTIDKSTATATHISEVPAGCGGESCSKGFSLAFAPDGTLYHYYYYYSKGFIESALMTLDPSTGAELTFTPSGFGGIPLLSSLAVRSDGIIFSNEAVRVPKPCGICPPPDPPFVSYLDTIDSLTGFVTRLFDLEGQIDHGGLAFSPVVVESVDIAIKPGSDPSVVNPLSRGVVPVAIFGSHDFDVANIDVTSLTFGFGDALPASVRRRNRDVDADGFPDLLLHFRIAETGIEIGDTEACLSGETLDGTPFSGCDTIRTVPDR